MAAGVGVGETPRSLAAAAAAATAAIPPSRFTRFEGVPSVLEAFDAFEGEGDGGARRLLLLPAASLEAAPRFDMMDDG